MVFSCVFALLQLLSLHAQPRFTAVIQAIPKWRLCSDNIQAAISVRYFDWRVSAVVFTCFFGLQFVADKVLSWPQQEFSEWMYEHKLPLFPRRSSE